MDSRTTFGAPSINPYAADTSRDSSVVSNAKRRRSSTVSYLETKDPTTANRFQKKPCQQFKHEDLESMAEAALRGHREQRASQEDHELTPEEAASFKDIHYCIFNRVLSGCSSEYSADASERDFTSRLAHLRTLLDYLNDCINPLVEKGEPITPSFLNELDQDCLSSLYSTITANRLWSEVWRLVSLPLTGLVRLQNVINSSPALSDLPLVSGRISAIIHILCPVQRERTSFEEMIEAHVRQPPEPSSGMVPSLTRTTEAASWADQPDEQTQQGRNDQAGPEPNQARTRSPKRVTFCDVENSSPSSTANVEDHDISVGQSTQPGPASGDTAVRESSVRRQETLQQCQDRLLARLAAEEDRKRSDEQAKQQLEEGQSAQLSAENENKRLNEQAVQQIQDTILARLGEDEKRRSNEQAEQDRALMIKFMTESQTKIGKLEEKLTLLTALQAQPGMVQQMDPHQKALLELRTKQKALETDFFNIRRCMVQGQNPCSIELQNRYFQSKESTLERLNLLWHEFIQVFCSGYLYKIIAEPLWRMQLEAFYILEAKVGITFAIFHGAAYTEASHVSWRIDEILYLIDLIDKHGDPIIHSIKVALLEIHSMLLEWQRECENNSGSPMSWRASSPPMNDAATNTAPEISIHTNANVGLGISNGSGGVPDIVPRNSAAFSNHYIPTGPFIPTNTFDRISAAINQTRVRTENSGEHRTTAVALSDPDWLIRQVQKVANGDCADFKAGRCWLGNGCPYSHNVATTTAAQSGQGQAQSVWRRGSMPYANNMPPQSNDQQLWRRNSTGAISTTRFGTLHTGNGVGQSAQSGNLGNYANNMGGNSSSDLRAQQPCRNMARNNRCNRRGCPYDHSPQSNNSQFNTNGQNNSNGRCLLQNTPGGCTRPNCPFQHDGDLTMNNGGTSDASTIQCRWANSARGCLNQNCPYDHNVPVDSTGQNQRSGRRNSGQQNHSNQRHQGGRSNQRYQGRRNNQNQNQNQGQNQRWRPYNGNERNRGRHNRGNRGN